ncbi:MAG: pentapeptide repeat-containing protein [Acidobacteria bacterium]|nr:pentapeptide repeat-containing protein [Acidobacteriota bacterium]
MTLAAAGDGMVSRAPLVSRGGLSRRSLPVAVPPACPPGDRARRRSPILRFTGSRFAGSRFAGSRFTGSRFAGSRFTGSRFAGSRVRRCQKRAGRETRRIPLPDSPIHRFTDSPTHRFTDSPIHRLWASPPCSRT